MCCPGEAMIIAVLVLCKDFFPVCLSPRDNQRWSGGQGCRFRFGPAWVGPKPARSSGGSRRVRPAAAAGNQLIQLLRRLQKRIRGNPNLLNLPNRSPDRASIVFASAIIARFLKCSMTPHVDRQKNLRKYRPASRSSLPGATRRLMVCQRLGFIWGILVICRRAKSNANTEPTWRYPEHSGKKNNGSTS